MVIEVDHSISRCKLSVPETHIRALPVLPGSAPGKRSLSREGGGWLARGERSGVEEDEEIEASESGGLDAEMSAELASAQALLDQPGRFLLLSSPCQTKSHLCPGSCPLRTARIFDEAGSLKKSGPRSLSLAWTKWQLCICLVPGLSLSRY
ncbi:hypothetical protein KM043_005966 [Ampulex compressa]|nr:hypothetical protein KM043_005966 [Ampulex compressa]